jgi:uncharacterized protein YndB with AHSA1/START domain
MQVSELNRIERSVRIRAPRARVWRALTDSREFGRWFGVEVAGTFQAGARVQMTCTLATACGADQSPIGIVFSVEVQQVVPEQLFSWRWHPGMPRPGVDYSKEPTTLVEFRLEDADGGTRLTVTESGFDRISLTRRAAVFQENEAGWAHQAKAIADYVSQTT